MNAEIKPFQTFTIYGKIFDERKGEDVNFSAYAQDAFLSDQTKWQVTLTVIDRTTGAVASTTDNGVPLLLNAVYAFRDVIPTDVYYAVHEGLPPGHYRYSFWGVLENLAGNRLQQIPWNGEFDVISDTRQPTVPA